MTIDQMPRQLSTQLSHAPRDQHRPRRLQPPRQLHHLLADVPPIRHVLQRGGHMTQIVGRDRQGLEDAELKQLGNLLQQPLNPLGIFCMRSINTKAM